MKWGWMVLLLAALLCTTACKRSDNKPNVKDEDLNLNLESGVKADPSEIDGDRDKPAGDETSDEKPLDSAKDDAAP